MKISRIALLSAILFVGQYTFTSDNTTDTSTTQTTTTITTENKDILPVDQTPSTENKVKEEINKIEQNAKDAGTKIKDETSSLVKKLGGLVVVPFVAANKLAGTIADNTINKVVSMITSTKYLQNTRLNNQDYIKMFGKVVVFTAAGYGVYKLYSLYNAQEDDNDDMIFDTEYDDNN